MKLELIKSAKFGEVQADIYKSGDEPYMTTEQLGNCLGFSSGRKSVDKVVERNAYLKKSEFSTTVKITAVDGKQRNVRVFTEDGIYEVTMLAKTERAKEFRSKKSPRAITTKTRGQPDQVSKEWVRFYYSLPAPESQLLH